jgi:threonine synthase
VCGAPLLARYDLTAARRWPKSTLAGREASMWRYREILPLLQSAKGLDAAVSLGEGWTPLVRARRLGATLSLRRLYVKDEGLNPTGSWKARGFSAALTRAMHVGARGVVTAAAGLAAPAAAAYSARAALPAKIFTPKDGRRAFAADSELYGADIAQVDGTLADAERAAEAYASQSGSYDLCALHEPYRVEGQKTMGYEIAEQLGWELPDWILCPVASGSTFIGIWKAFVEMASLGWIDPVRRPHMVAIQPAGCAPIVRAVAASAEHAEPWSADAIRTLADDLRVPDPTGASLGAARRPQRRAWRRRRRSRAPRPRRRRPHQTARHRRHRQSRDGGTIRVVSASHLRQRSRRASAFAQGYGGPPKPWRRWSALRSGPPDGVRIAAHRLPERGSKPRRPFARRHSAMAEMARALLASFRLVST